MADVREAIARNISALRQGAGMTQAELAERLCYSDKAVSKWERGDSVPDVGVLKDVADLFGVTLDALVSDPQEGAPLPQKTHAARPFIAAISVVLVWLIATLAFVVLDLLPGGIFGHWLAFVCAVPVSCVVWLVFNVLWFRKKLLFLILSLLMWSALAAVFLVFLNFGRNIWPVFLLGAPGQIILFLWAKMPRK